MRISDWSSDVCSSDLPSWIERIEIAPLSVLFPNWLVSATYKEPFEFDIPAMMASGSIPRKTPFVEKKATDRPNNTALPNFANNKTPPFSTDGSAALARTSVVSVKRVSVRVELGGGRHIEQKKKQKR